MLKVIVNCGPCEDWIGHCLSSLRNQSFRDWEAYVTVDPCGDLTWQRAIEGSRFDPRIHITRNQRRQFSMRNLVEGVARSGAGPEEVIVVLDGDDWLMHDDALRIIARTYATTGCWMTYGSWTSNDPLRPGCWPAYADTTTNFRTGRWLATAVRTWKKWLWDLIDPADFRDPYGDYFRVVEDLACMFPMMEMSTLRHMRHISDVLMLYNRTNPNNTVDIMGDEMEENDRCIRSRPRYRALHGKVLPALIHGERPGIVLTGGGLYGHQ
ncbi:MAG: putative Glycosyl transferase [Acidobacteria bacterium]|nr:putative Glycosyl transferase [Acidobacteriota bacterium]